MAEIRFKRGTSNKIEQNKERELAYGQPLFNSDKNYLTVGNKENKSYDIQPIITRELHGWASDDDSIKALSTSNEEYYIKSDVIKYFGSSNKEKSLNIFSDVGEDNKSIALSVKYNDGKKQSIKPAIYIKNKISAKAQDDLNVNIYGNEINLGENDNNSVIDIHGIVSIKGQVALDNVLTANITDLTAKNIKTKTIVENGLELKNTTTLSGTISNGTSLFIRNSDNNDSPALQSSYAKITNLTTTNINANKVEAQYFNAKSDRRLKKNIIEVNDFDFINMIKNVPINTFQYKNIDYPEKFIGIIAQDLINYEIDNVKLYNLNSEDYYTIKENKLVYVLWGALRQLINKLEK